VRVSLHAPWISHLLFADDCLIFTQASKRGADRINAILHDYNKGSGQLVNKSKSAVFFSSNCEQGCKTEVMQSLQIPNEALGERYLGLPTAAERGSTDVFNYVPARVRGMVNGWAEKNLSCAAREVLLKANAQSVPTYAMSCFKLSPTVCGKLTSMVSNYWWGSSLDNHKIHWLRWEKLTRSKDQGGVGFRDFSLFNKAMLGKQGWRLMMRPDSLCARVLRGKYYHSSNFLSATKKKRSSATWKSILHGRGVLEKGLIYRIGPGDINPWENNWIPGVGLLRPLIRLESATANRVSDLFIPGTRVWDMRQLRKNFLALDIVEILKIKPSMRSEHDVVAWAFEKSGTYSVRSAYKLLKDEQMASAMVSTGETCSSGNNRAWKAVWKMNVPPKVRVFWWRILHKSLPSKAELKRRHIAQEGFCEVCGDPEESIYHVVNSCTVARRFWEKVTKLTGLKIPNLHPSTWATDVLFSEICSADIAALYLCGAWALWTGRNGRRHGRKVWEPGSMARYIATLLEELETMSMPTRNPKPVRHTKWQKPERGWFKVNTDAAFNSGSCTGSAGVIVRNHQGLVQAAAARWFDDIADALNAEAVAAKEGLELAMEIGCDRVVLEVDSKLLQSYLQTGTGERTAIGGLCFDITELGRSFREFKIVWVSREANSVADHCAQLVSPTERSFFWLDYVPDWLLGLAAADCTPDHD
jgi:ribonuclease HI